MKKRARIPKSIHVGTNTPDGKAQIGEMAELQKQFEAGTITEEGLRKLATFMAIARKVKKLQVLVIDKVTDITPYEWENIYKPAGFKLL